MTAGGAADGDDRRKNGPLEVAIEMGSLCSADPTHPKPNGD